MSLTRYFCDNCSSVLWKESDAEHLTGTKLVFAGTLDLEEREDLPVAQGELWTSQRPKWMSPVEGAQQAVDFGSH